MTRKIPGLAAPCLNLVLSTISSPFKFSAMKNIITHFREASLLLLVLLSTLSVQAAAAKGEIKGKVTDEKGEGLVAAVVQIIDGSGKNTGYGTSTDYNGNYLLANLEAGSYTLKASSIGYNSRTAKAIAVTAGKGTTQNFRLAAAPKVFDMVVVSGVKYERKFAEQSYSINTVSADQAYAPPAKAAPLSSYSAGYVQQHFLIEKKTGFEAVDMEDIAPDPVTVPKDKTDITTNESYKNIIDNAFISPARAPLSTFSIDVDVASYGIIRKKIGDGMLPPADAVRIEEMVNYFPYSYADPADEKPFAVHTEFATCPWDTTHRLLRIGIQGKHIEEAKLPPSNLVFLVDVSGSMMSPERLPLIQKSLDMLTDSMRPQDRIALVAYAGNAGLVLPSTSGADKERIKHAIDHLEGGGSTAGGAGIELAYKVAVDNFIKNGNNRVLLCTDGDFNVGVSSENDLTKLIEEKRKTGVFLSVLGVGTGNYKDREMETLADKGNGNYAYLDNEKEARKNLVTQMGGTLHTIAKDVKIQAVFNPSCVKSYRLIGYENRKLADRDFADDKIDAGEIGAGTAVTALYEVVLGPDRKATNVPLEDPSGYGEMALTASDLIALRIRYKAPDGHKSQLIESHVSVTASDLSATTEDFRFAASVASFGMLLRGSAYKGDFTYDKVKALAGKSLGADKEGYRAEFIDMVDDAEDLATKTASK